MSVEAVTGLCVLVYIFNKQVGKAERAVSRVDIYVEAVAHIQHLRPHLGAVYLRENLQILLEHQLPLNLSIARVDGLHRNAQRRHLRHLHRHEIALGIVQKSLCAGLLLAAFHSLQNVVYELLYSLHVVFLRLLQLQVLRRTHIEAVLGQQMGSRFRHVLLLVHVLIVCGKHYLRVLHGYQTLALVASLRLGSELHLEEVRNEHIERETYEVVPREGEHIGHVVRHQSHSHADKLGHTSIGEGAAVKSRGGVLHAEAHQIVDHREQHQLAFLTAGVLHCQQPCAAEPCVECEHLLRLVLSVHGRTGSCFDKKGYTLLQQSQRLGVQRIVGIARRLEVVEKVLKVFVYMCGFRFEPNSSVFHFLYVEYIPRTKV